MSYFPGILCLSDLCMQGNTNVMEAWPSVDGAGKGEAA